MPTIHCPHCDQPLTISEKSLGSNVACPTCTHDFLVPGVVSVPSLSLGGPAPAFDFGEGESTGYRRVRVQTMVGPAAAWMNTGLVLSLIFTMGFLAINVYTMLVDATWFAIVLGLTVTFLHLPMAFAAVGANALQRLWSAGFARAGAILILVVAVEQLALSVWLALTVAGYLRFEWLDRFIGAFGIVVILLILLGIVAAATCIIGGVRALMTMNHPDVSESFR